MPKIGHEALNKIARQRKKERKRERELVNKAERGDNEADLRSTRANSEAKTGRQVGERCWLSGIAASSPGQRNHAMEKKEPKLGGETRPIQD